MKLSKSLLSAILIGIAVQTSSCTKDKEICEDKEKKEAKEKETKKSIYECPACGMG